MTTDNKKVAPAKKRRQRLGFSVPCPRCGKSSRVFRTTLGERYRKSARRADYVVRERRCTGTAKHRFHTEERSR